MSWANGVVAVIPLDTPLVDPIALKAIQWKYYLVYIGINTMFLGLVPHLVSRNNIRVLETFCGYGERFDSTTRSLHRGGTIEQASSVFDQVNGMDNTEEGRSL
ncbi:hypothetical protein GYMLUDRAFT_249115 [Collybiopsis luxurians FD-317 M1]|uniref:Uncharacterized protein n=1 Tax=Collybiopsis luxurians FD-317 M1 TaxID=944289 RepID=A0A0D0CIX9_9AGAR|nr:hypothetical protein GYMLUDRAFT_249115 [Collybiopsis luxurians FD-317 M1]